MYCDPLHLPVGGNSGLSECTIIHKHKHMQTHTHNIWGPGGVFQAEGSQGTPGDKADRNDENNMEEEKQGFFHRQTVRCTVYLQA